MVPLLLAAAPKGPNDADVSPGLAGFLTVFVLALALVLLIRSMVKHLRNVRYGPGPDGAGPEGADPRRPPGATDPAAPGGPTVPAAPGDDGPEPPGPAAR